MPGISHCPVCDEIDDCEHRLVEWYGWPGQRIRGSLTNLISRMEGSVVGLLVECSVANIPPLRPELRGAFDAATGIIESVRDQAAAEYPDEDEWERAYWGAAIDTDEVREEIRDEVTGRATEFVIELVKSAPGVTVVVLEEPVSAVPESEEWVSVFAVDPARVWAFVLEALASLEVQHDQLHFARIDSSSLIGRDSGTRGLVNASMTCQGDTVTGTDDIDVVNDLASRDPRQFPYAILAGDSFVLSSLRLFFWFESIDELIHHVLEVEPRLYEVVAGAGLEKYQARVRPILARVQTEGLTEHLRRELSPNEDGGFAIDWWGRYEDLRDGRDDFGCEVRDRFVRRSGRSVLSPLEQEDDFVDFLRNYGV